jgi:hypothetical protein
MSTKKNGGRHFKIYQKFITFVGARKKMSVVAEDKKFVAYVPKKVNKKDVWVLAKAEKGVIKRHGVSFFLNKKNLQITLLPRPPACSWGSAAGACFI